jgi:thiazole tautomerase (transcriptional regulator TenI)
MSADRAGPGPGLPALHVVTTGELLERPDFATAAPALVRALGPALALHLRGPGTPGRRLLELAQTLAGECRDAGALLVVNDRLDVALAAGAGGVQLGRRSLPAGAVRPLLGGLRLGVSAHSAAEVEAAAEAGADFALLGTIYATPSHPGVKGAGPERVRECAGMLPLVAIGGVTPDRVGELLAAGAHGVAVVRGVWGAEDPVAAAGEYARALAAGASADGGRATVRVTVNGEGRQIDAGLTVAGYLELLGLHPRMIVVEYNREILDRARFDEVVLREGDGLELVHFVGGG